MGHLLMKTHALQVGYSGRALLPPLDLEIHCGDFLAVVGRNGSGKTTLFKTLLGLIPPVAGEVKRLDRSVAYVPQRMAFDELFPASVRDVVAMGLLGVSKNLPSQHGVGGTIRQRVMSAIDELGLADLSSRTFRSLSEGQKQRVLMARVLAAGARLVFLDEPTAAMDIVAERESMDLLAHLQSVHGMALVVVNHHMEVALRLANSVLFVDPDSPRPLLGSPAEVLASPAFKARYGDISFESVRA